MPQSGRLTCWLAEGPLFERPQCGWAKPNRYCGFNVASVGHFFEG